MLVVVMNSWVNNSILNYGYRSQNCFGVEKMASRCETAYRNIDCSGSVKRKEDKGDFLAGESLNVMAGS